MKNFAAVVALCLPLLAHAQNPPTPPGPAGSSGLSSVQAQLGLQDGQTALWQKYETAVNAYLSLHYQERPVVASENDAAPAQIRRLVDSQSNRLAALEDIETAARNLYAALSPAQQKLANQSLLATIPVMGGGAAPYGGPAPEKGGKPDGSRQGHRPGGPGAGMGNMGGMGR